MFDEFLQHEVNRLNVPGLAVVINEAESRGIREVYAGGIGYRDAERSEPVTPDTLFGVASVTKVVTAAEILRLAEEGRLSIDDPVVRQLPALQIAHQSPIKIRHLLSHSAGFPGLASRFNAVDLDSSSHSTEAAGGTQSNGLLNTADLVEYLNTVDLQLIADPGDILNYSNESFCLLGGIVEQQRTLSYPDAIANSVFERLQLNRSFIGSVSLSDKENIAYPLIRNGAGFQRRPFWDAPLFYSAGGLVMSARDSAQLIGGIFSNPQFLSPDSQKLLSSNVIAVPSRPNSGSGYGYGLEYRQIDSGNTIMWHTGQRPGVSSFVAFHLEQRIAVSVLSNVADVPVASVGYELLGKLMQRNDFVWPPVHPTFEPTDSSSMSCDGRFLSEEGFDYHIQTNDGLTRLSLNQAPGSDHSDAASSGRTGARLHFRDQCSGTVGAHTFCYLPDANLKTDRGNSKSIAALAIDLRVIPECK